MEKSYKRNFDQESKHKMPWESLDKNNQEPIKINTLLNTIMNRLAGTSGTEIEKIFNNWEKIIDPKFIEHAHPMHVYNKCLYIQTNNAAVAKDLQWRSEKILENVNKILPNTSLETVKIRIKN